jgi:hypothetical protein
MIRRRSRDILIKFTIPLPRRWWRRKPVSESARQNMSAAQKRRAALERESKL